MIRRIKCIYCGSRTGIVYKRIRSTRGESIIILHQAPVHYCSLCKDTIMPLEVISTLKHIKTLRLRNGINEFNFEDIYRKVNVG